MAEHFLKSFPENSRPINQKKVDEYVKLMNEGAWEVRKKSSLAVEAETGIMQDGKHRLLAFLASELKTFKTWLKVVGK